MRSWVRLLAVLSIVAGLAGCADEPETPGAAAAAPRIVSLSPAISRTLVDLGVGENVVGRTRYCRTLASSVPVVGDLEGIDYQRLLRLEPTHVLVQPPAAGVDAELTRLAADRGWRIGAWRIDTIDDIRRLIDELPPTLFDDAGERADARRRADALLASLDGVLDGHVGWSGRVLLVHDVDPVGVFGASTYLAEVVEAMGAVNAAAGEGWLTLTMEDVTRLDPEALILIRPGEAADADLGPMAELPVAAIEDGRTAVLTHEDALLPCSGLVGTAAELRTILEGFAAAESPR